MSPTVTFAPARSAGFTVIELMVAVLVLGILLALAIPSFRNTILDSRRTAAVNEVLVALQSARVEAFKQSRDGYVCPSLDNGATCSTSATAWSSGWLVWVDLDSDGTFDSPAERIRYLANDNKGVTITTNATGAQIRYRPFQVGMTGASIAVCDERGASDSSQHRSVVVANTGRPRVAEGDTAGICP